MKIKLNIFSGLGKLFRIPDFFKVGSSIRTKLIISFLLMIMLTIAVSAVSYLFQKKIGQINHELELDINIVENALEAEKYALEARRNEKDYLLRYREVGFAKAEQFVEKVKQNVAQFYESVGHVSDSAEAKANDIKRNQVLQRIDILYQSVYDYETAFSALVDELKTKGEVELFGRDIQKDAAIASLMNDFNDAALRISPLIKDMVDIAKEESEAQKQVLRDIEKTTQLVTVVATVLALIIGIFLALALSGTLTKQTRNIMNLFGQIGMGDLNARADILTRDELGTMAESLNAMLDNTLSLIQSREERDSLQSSIMTLLEEISALTEGDLSARAQVTAEATGALADSFNTMAEQLGSIVANVKKAATHVTDTSRDVKSSTDHLAQSSEQQAVQISDAIAAINEMATSIAQVAEHATKSAQVSQQSTENAKEGSDAVDQTSKAMESIRDNVQETARSIKRLGESSQEIGNIVQIINDIAERTSILALNASIQAAMAA